MTTCSYNEPVLVTVVGGDIYMLDDMLAHYVDLGVGRISLNLHLSDPDSPVRETVTTIAAKHDTGIQATEVGPWSQEVNPRLYAQEMDAHPDTWYVIADQDELHRYPCDLQTLIEYCEVNGYDYVEGCLLDRLAEEGRLASVSDHEPMWTQYPHAGFVSQPLFGVCPKKVVLAKGHVALTWGQHGVRSGEGAPPEDVLIPVHHFKWTADVVDREQERSDLYQMLDEPFSEESDRIVQYFEKKGRLAVLDEDRFLFRNIGEERYPEWETIRKYYVRHAGEW